VKALTDPQLRALKEVAEDRVRWSRYEMRYYSTEWPPAIRSDVVLRLVDAGLADVGPHVPGMTSSRHVVLTDAGQMRLVAGA
jgi:hypothetical protein